MAARSTSETAILLPFAVGLAGRTLFILLGMAERSTSETAILLPFAAGLTGRTLFILLLGMTEP